MARRSARLRGQTPDYEPRKDIQPLKPILPSLVERDETPEVDTPAVASVPATPANKPSPNSTVPRSNRRSVAKTPESRGPLKPGLEEMHPSKVQQSTSKKPDTGLRLGFRPIHTNNDTKHPFNMNSTTPTKSKPSNTDQKNKDLDFDFKFTCEDAQLSHEAKQLMENIREDAARIKASMVTERDTKTRNGISDKPETRIIAKPKGKAGRFSDAHMAEFKKMDSIAGHPSAFRTKLDRFQAQAQGTPVKSLKRTISKAKLDDPGKADAPKTKSTTGATPGTPRSAATTKRRKNLEGSELSTRPPLLGDGQLENRAQPKPTASSAAKFTTPRKPTVERPSSVKHPHTTKIPSFARSPSHKSLRLPKTPQTDIKLNHKLDTFGQGNLKSILRRPQPLFSNDPVKVAAGTHQYLPQTDLKNKLLDISESPTANSAPSIKKRVEFSSSTKLRDACNETSPSASKTPVHISTSEDTTNPGEVIYPSLPPTTPPHEENHSIFSFKVLSPTIRKVAPAESPSRRITFGKHLPNRHGIVNKKRNREDIDEEPKTPSVNDGSPDGRVQKRFKPNPTTPTALNTPSPTKKRPLPHTPSRRTPGSTAQKPRGSLSMSRLNLLSRPKGRR